MPVVLTDRFLRGMKPETGGARPEVFDQNARGLSVRCGATGCVSFAFNYSAPSSGQRRRVKIGTYPAFDLKAARDEASRLRRLVETGRDPIEIAKADKRRLTVAQLLERYIAAITPSHRSAAKVKLALTRDMIPVIGHRPAEEIRRRDVIEILDAIAERGAKVHANRVCNMISAMFAWALAEDLPGIETNPARNIRKRVQEKPKSRWLTEPELTDLWRVLDDLPAAKRDALRLILLTGQRPGEVTGIRLAELDLSRELWTIPADRAKNKHTHAVPLAGEALAIAKRLVTDVTKAELQRHSGRLLLVRERGVRALTTNNLNIALGKALKQAKINDAASPHDLRRTALTHLARLGVDPHVIAHVANHVSVTRNNVTGAVYIRHSYEPQKRMALAAWDTDLKHLVDGRAPPSNVVALPREAVAAA